MSLVHDNFEAIIEIFLKYALDKTNENGYSFV